MLEILRQKALEREELFDDVEATFHFTSEGSPRRQTDRAMKAHWIRSGHRRLMEYEDLWSRPAPGSSMWYGKKVVDGTESRKFFYSRRSGELSGYIYSPVGRPDISDHFTPECYGVTALPIVGGEGESGLGSLARFLDPSTPPRDDRLARTLAPPVKRVVDGRVLWVVEEYLTRPLDPYNDPSGKGPKWEHKTTLYFDPALNYSCVVMETHLEYGGELHRTSREVMSDFREVKPGLFVPHLFEQQWERKDWRGYPGDKWTNTYRVDELAIGGQFDEALFDISFPDGTNVVDQISGFRYMVGGTDPFTIDTLALEDVSTGAAEDAEDIESPEPAAEVATRTLPPQAPVPSSQGPGLRSQHLVLAIAVVVLLATAALVLLRVRQKRRRP